MPARHWRARPGGVARVAYILLCCLTAGLYLTMAAWSLPRIAEAAGGMRAFDLRPFGYTPDEAAAFLAALSEEGRAFYAGTQHALDRVFPVVLAVWAVWTLRLLFATPWRWGLAGLAIAGMLFDMAENAAVARLLSGFDRDVAQAAARWTVLKSAAATVVYCAILWGGARRVWRRARR